MFEVSLADDPSLAMGTAAIMGRRKAIHTQYAQTASRRFGHHRAADAAASQHNQFVMHRDPSMLVVPRQSHH